MPSGMMAAGLAAGSRKTRGGVGGREGLHEMTWSDGAQRRQAERWMPKCHATREKGAKQAADLQANLARRADRPR